MDTNGWPRFEGNGGLRTELADCSPYATATVGTLGWEFAVVSSEAGALARHTPEIIGSFSETAMFLSVK